MADAPFPPSLPQPQYLPTTYTLADNRLVTTMDAGPAKVRRRATGKVAWFACASGLYTRTQLNTFWTFWRTTLKDGSLSFIWRDPSEATTTEVSVRFDPLHPPPEFEAIGSEGEIKFRAIFNLERLP